MRIEQRMPPFEGVAAGNTALIKLPIGRRFHSLYLTYSGVTLAQMTDSDSLESQEYAQGNEKNDWYWAYMVKDMYEDDMWTGDGAKTLAFAASSAIFIA